MAPVLKTYKQRNRQGKRKADDLDEESQGDISSRDLKKKRNKQRVLLLSSRGITHRMRHLMNDLETLLPHVKKGVCMRMDFRLLTRITYRLLSVKC
jgi:ribosome biogenesis protein BRX1